ncbi:two component transcriptional regulator, LuxR family [Rhodopirellula sp. SWK7]|nr:two component transcriptional regulator, LuxR family [Rhodopirellula sp. SWK7]
MEIPPMNIPTARSHAIRVMIIEDHPDYREVVEIALEREDDFELIGTYGAVEVALRSLQNRDDRNMPDVILLDLNLPGISGLEAIPSFEKQYPNAKIIALTQSEQEADVIRAISLGASGYLVKSATVSDIKTAIRGVVKGEATLDSRVAKYVLGALRGSQALETIDGHLTPRELEVLELLADGLTKKEIARTLRLSTSTVSTHVVHVFEKLKVPNAPAAIAKAFRSGLFRAR